MSSGSSTTTTASNASKSDNKAIVPDTEVSASKSLVHLVDIILD